MKSEAGGARREELPTSAQDIGFRALVGAVEATGPSHTIIMLKYNKCKLKKLKNIPKNLI